MILVETANPEPRDFEEAVIFVSQLRAAGFDACISSRQVSPEFWPAFRFAAQPFVRDAETAAVDTLMVLGADRSDDDTLNATRRTGLVEGANVHLFGRFETRQAEISAVSKYSYVTGIEPVTHSLSELAGVDLEENTCPPLGVRVSTAAPGDGAPIPVALFAPDLGDRDKMAVFQGLLSARAFSVSAATSGKQKTAWSNANPPGLPVFQYSEMSPAAFGRRGQVLVLAGAGGANAWAQCVINNGLASDQVVIDATAEQMYSQANPNILRGPSHVSQIGDYLREVVAPNLDGLLDEARQATKKSTALLLEGYLKASGVAPGSTTGKPEECPAKKTWIMPTNGVGLGHARRCLLIAREFEHTKEVAFAAFPSCLPMIRENGFDAMPLVQRSNLHKDGFANDLVNLTRLHSAVGHRDRFVFDGGYVFDSVMRTVLEHDLDAIWVRRGLWTAAQDNRIPLDREKIFSRVIVPREAFDDLNAPLSSGSKVFEVGPVVERFTDPDLRDSVRRALSEEFERGFETLSVTMLGGGVAADLSAHVQAACAEFDRRPGHLNLIVNWPGAVVRPVWYGWENSVVVSTIRASLLALACDFMISAAGYNSFHEAMYNQIPAIFIPQMAAFMDDQAARADLAGKMGVATYVEAERPAALTREIGRLLDRGILDDLRGALAGLDLPEPGNARAAQLIEERAR